MKIILSIAIVVFLFCLAEYNISFSGLYKKPGNSIFSQRVMTYTNTLVKKFCRDGYYPISEMITPMENGIKFELEINNGGNIVVNELDSGQLNLEELRCQDQNNNWILREDFKRRIVKI